MKNLSKSVHEAEKVENCYFRLWSENWQDLCNFVNMNPISITQSISYSLCENYAELFFPAKSKKMQKNMWNFLFDQNFLTKVGVTKIMQVNIVFCLNNQVLHSKKPMFLIFTFILSSSFICVSCSNFIGCELLLVLNSKWKKSRWLAKKKSQSYTEFLRRGRRAIAIRNIFYFVFDKWIISLQNCF